MITKLVLVLSLLRSKTYVVLTDTKAIVMIPLMDIDKFDNILLLSAQTAALTEFKERLTDLIGEHDTRIKQLTNRKDSKLFDKSK